MTVRCDIDLLSRSAELRRLLVLLLTLQQKTAQGDHQYTLRSRIDVRRRSVQRPNIAAYRDKHLKHVYAAVDAIN